MLDLSPTTPLLALGALLAAGLWALAAARPRGPLVVAASLGSLLAAALLTWRVVALNRAGLALPEERVSPAIDGWRAVLPTLAWAVAVAQVLSQPLRPAPGPLGRPCRPASLVPLAELPAALLILGLLAWPRLATSAGLVRGARQFGADGRAVLLLGLALASSALMLRNALARYGPPRPPRSRGGGTMWNKAGNATDRGPNVGQGRGLLPPGIGGAGGGRCHLCRALVVVGAVGATVALALLARHLQGGQGGWRPATGWLATLAGLHLLAEASALARRDGSAPPVVSALVAHGLLVAYVALATVGRIAGAG
jgi:hypothetical protein